MKANELRRQSVEDLHKHLLELRKEQFNLRMQQGVNRLEKPSRMREVRREIARLKTVMGERKGPVLSLTVGFEASSAAGSSK